jgi:SOS-response transcriptional repressor LexA
MLTTGQLLRRAMQRAGLTQVELARRSGVDKYSIGAIANDDRDPQLSTLRKLVAALQMTWATFFDEAQLAFSPEEARAVRTTRDALDRLLENDAALKAMMPAPPPVRHDKQSRWTSRLTSEIRDPGDEVRRSDAEIPEWHYRNGSRLAFTVTTDSMTGPGSGILEGATIFVRRTVDVDNADGEIVVCILNGTHYLKKLDRRGGETVLHSTRKGYPELVVTQKDVFALVGVVVLQPTDSE